MESLTPGWSRSELYTNIQAYFPSEGLKDLHLHTLPYTKGIGWQAEPCNPTIADKDRRGA